jgi:hypothetical protein
MRHAAVFETSGWLQHVQLEIDGSRLSEPVRTVHEHEKISGVSIKMFNECAALETEA